MNMKLKTISVKLELLGVGYSLDMYMLIFCRGSLLIQGQLGLCDPKVEEFIVRYF